MLCLFLWNVDNSFAIAITIATMTKTITILAISIITIMLVSRNEKIGDSKAALPWISSLSSSPSS